MSAKIEYRTQIDALIRNTLDEMQCQPILFAGSGLSRRYSDLPDWKSLLRKIGNIIGVDDEGFAYLSQKNDHDPMKLGSALTEASFEWAWATGKNHFPKELFLGGADKSIFAKTLACEVVNSLTVNPLAITDEVLKAEVDRLRLVKPHAIITTNYDKVLSAVFEDYEEVVGQKIIKSNLDYFGEIFKIHGCVTDPTSIVLNESDYADYRKKRKYLSAKLLTYLSEHPVFIMGYSINDPNVIEIIDDVGEVLGGEDQLIPNLFYVEWKSSIDYDAGLPSEKVIIGSQGKYRVRSIQTDEFGWIFQSLTQERELSDLNTKVLRALLARTYNLIRSDIPRKKVEVNYDTLEHAVAEVDALPALLGISKADNTNLTHPYVLSQVGQKLGFPSWHGAHKLLQQILAETGVDIKKTDNLYHCKIKVGKADKSSARKWSEAAVSLFEKVRDGDNYELDVSMTKKSKPAG